MISWHFFLNHVVTTKIKNLCTVRIQTKMNYVVKEKLRVDSVVYLHVYWL